MKLSREARRTARELFDLTVVNGRVHPDRVREVTDALLASKPRHSVGILKEITRLVRLDVENHHAIIESATALTAATAQQIASALRSQHGDITTEFRENPALIGGIRIRIGSNVWDGSIAARLQAIENHL